MLFAFAFLFINSLIRIEFNAEIFRSSKEPGWKTAKKWRNQENKTVAASR